MPDALEIETKLIVTDPVDMRGKLIGLGAVSSGRVFERNIRLDTPDRLLSRQGIVLRMRSKEAERDIEHILTVKTSGGRDSQNIRIAREIETSVTDSQAMVAALEVLGFHPYWVYEKHREAFAWEGVTADLDEVPCGWFLELEGDKEQIIKLAALLGHKIEEGLSLSYADIFDNVKRNLRLEMHDFTFETFRGIAVSPQDYLLK
jgi:adenylate cyclase class 2